MAGLGWALDMASRQVAPVCLGICGCFLSNGIVRRGSQNGLYIV